MKQRENMQKEEEERIARMAAEERKAKEKKLDEQHTDPGKVAGDQSGKQEMHHDDYQGTSATAQPGQPTEPTPEMESEQKLREERKAPTGVKD